KHHADGEKINSLEEAPEAIKDFIDTENENVIILRNQTVAYASISKELEDQGVIFTDIFTSLRVLDEFVKKYYITYVLTKDNHKYVNVIILSNKTVAFASIRKELEDQCVIFTDIFT